MVTRRRMLVTSLAAVPSTFFGRQSLGTERSMGLKTASDSSEPLGKKPAKPVMTIGDVALHRIEELRIPNKIDYFATD